MIPSKHVMVIEWCMYTITVLLTTARIALHIHKRTHQSFVPDLWLLVAILDCTGLIVCDTLTYKANSLSVFFIEAPLRVRKLRFALSFFFDFGLYFPKFSMLAFFTQIVPNTFPRLRKALWCVIGFVTCSSITTLFAATFWCGTDISSNWSSDPNACIVIESMSFAKLSWSLNFISEVLILVFPFPLLRDLKFQHRSERVGLIIVFLLGGITIVASTARFTGQLLVKNKNTVIYVLAMTEYTVSIIILSLISLRPLLRKLYRVENSPFSRSNGAKKTGGQSKTSATTPRASRRKVSRAVYEEKLSSRNMYGSEVELTEVEEGKIYKTKEIKVTIGNEAEPTDDSVGR